MVALLDLLKEQKEAVEKVNELNREFDLYCKEITRLIKMKEDHPEWEESLQLDIERYEGKIQNNQTLTDAAYAKSFTLLAKIKKQIMEV